MHSLCSSFTPDVSVDVTHVSFVHKLLALWVLQVEVVFTAGCATVSQMYLCVFAVVWMKNVAPGHIEPLCVFVWL